jgi:hypothetical protein
MTACVAYAEAFLLPVIARDTPEVFGWEGPVLTSWAFAYFLTMTAVTRLRVAKSNPIPDGHPTRAFSDESATPPTRASSMSQRDTLTAPVSVPTLP